MHFHPYLFMHARGKNSKLHMWKKAFFSPLDYLSTRNPNGSGDGARLNNKMGIARGNTKKEQKAVGVSAVYAIVRKKKNRQLNTVPLRTAMLMQKMDGKDCKGYSGKMNTKQPTKVELKSKPSRATF